MKLRYYDTSSMHKDLWHELDPRFKDIAGKYAFTANADAARADYLNRILPNYAEEVPLLLLWHLGETHKQGPLSGQYRKTDLADEWPHWCENAKKNVYILFFSAGSTSPELRPDLPASQALLWPEPVRQGNMTHLKRMVKALEVHFKHAGTGANLAEWYLQTLPQQDAVQDQALEAAWELLHLLWQDLAFWPAPRSQRQTGLSGFQGEASLQAGFEAALKAENPQTLGPLLETLQVQLLALQTKVNEGLSYPLPGPCLHPPKGYEGLLLADDNPADLELWADLEQRGYHLHGPHQSREAALPHLSDAQVLICDYQLGSEQAGLQLMQDGLLLGRTVLAISRRPRRVPAQVLNACGVPWQELTEWIHRLIWQVAKARHPHPGCLSDFCPYSHNEV